MQQARHKTTAPAFSLIETLVAMALLAAAMAITFSAYFSVSRAWQRGINLGNNLDHGDYIMEQLVNGLRCAFFPPQGRSGAGGAYGFWLEKQASGSAARDSFSWVKRGADLLAHEDKLRRGLHRVRISVEADQDGALALASRAWLPYAQLDSFDPAKLDPFYVCGKLQGLACRVATNRTEQGWQWEESWEQEATNHLPAALEITLYLDPVEPGAPKLEIKRLVELPLAPLSWSRR